MKMGLNISKLASRQSNSPATQLKRQFPTRIPQFDFLKQHGEPSPIEHAQQSVRVNDKPNQLGLVLRNTLVNHQDGLHSPHSQRLQKLQTGLLFPQRLYLPSFSLPFTATNNERTGAIVYNTSETSTVFNKAIEHGEAIFPKNSNLTDTNSIQHDNNTLRSISTDVDQNQSVLFLSARQQLASQAAAEFSRLGKSAHQGRQFVDVGSIRQIIEMRDEKLGMTDSDIEKKLGLKTGTVIKLGNKSVVSTVN
ncbi:BgtA-21351 [Blumeria graminis f. sp. tritici]|uniref:BgtA-21351 n=2 Tax=Blumeria graminis f. sp. tritici TaxID=62690 RepID=A0A9X9QE09_BLUGR|nr:hypothetical protein BGT96224_A21351 [Blumeria graminis f. sp. tritici 96224]VDB90329.1 BgtA-21351 [Blumeria graminis f. sp. tritici]